MATGNSQRSSYKTLRGWSITPEDDVSVLHVDECIEMSDKHPARFRRYMHGKLVDSVHPRVFYGIEADTNDTECEIARYARLLADKKPVACMMGIGESGHLAVNDPPADFSIAASIHVVRLVETARQQQVGEGTPTRLLKPPQNHSASPCLRC